MLGANAGTALIVQLLSFNIVGRGASVVCLSG